MDKAEFMRQFSRETTSENPSNGQMNYNSKPMGSKAKSSKKWNGPGPGSPVAKHPNIQRLLASFGSPRNGGGGGCKSSLQIYHQ